jgi:hypothetical protein
MLKDGSLSFSISNRFDIINIIASLLISFLAFSYFCDIRILNPSFTKWLMPGDSETYWLNWLFYQQSSIFQIPIFKNYSYGNELSSTLALNDSLPIMALLYKSIQQILPENSQYFGPWILICFFLQSFFAIKILKKFSDDYILVILFSIFFAFAPIFIWRLWGHYSLMAHWLILWSLDIYFNKNFKLSKWLTIFLLSYLISAYIAVMMFIIFITDLIKRKMDKELGYKKISTILIIFFITSLTALYLIGYIEPGTKLSTSGFGIYKANLLTFFDSNGGWSNLFSDIRSIEGEHEGFAFLGSGVILLSIVTILHILFKKVKINVLSIYGYRQILFVSILLFILALSSNVHFGGFHIFSIDFPKFIDKILGIIRASGRMVWVPFYIAYITLFIGINSLNRKKVYRLVIVFFLCLNIVDMNKISNLFTLKTGDIEKNYKEVYSGPQHEKEYAYWKMQWNSPMKSEKWNNFSKMYNEINYIYPKNRPNNYFVLALYAAKNKMSVNFGSFSRVKKQKVKELISELELTVMNSTYDKKVLYYFDDENAWQNARKNMQEGDLVEIVDGFKILAPGYYINLNK